MSVSPASVEPAKPRTPSWLLVLLFVSLAANLLVVGSVGAAMWRFHRAPPPHWAPPNLLGYAMSLRPDRYEALWTASEQMRQKLRPIRQELRAARNEVTAAIVAEPFDQAAFEAAQKRLVEKEGQARLATLSLYAEIVKNLTPDERRGYRRWREHRRPPPIGILEDGDEQGEPRHRRPSHP